MSGRTDVAVERTVGAFLGLCEGASVVREYLPDFVLVSPFSTRQRQYVCLLRPLAQSTH
jgi:hypothetical protein